MMIKPFLSAICFSLLLATVPVQAAQQPAAEKTPAPVASTVERDDLGVPAFLRRPTRK